MTTWKEKMKQDAAYAHRRAASGTTVLTAPHDDKPPPLRSDDLASLKAHIVSPLVPLGTMTPWGKISAVGNTGGERYYWCIDKAKTVSMMPADVVERYYKEKS